MNRAIFAAASVLAVTQAISLKEEANPWAAAVDWAGVWKLEREFLANMPAHCKWPGAEWEEWSDVEKFTHQVKGTGCWDWYNSAIGTDGHTLAEYSVTNFLDYCRMYKLSEE